MTSLLYTIDLVAAGDSRTSTIGFINLVLNALVLVAYVLVHARTRRVAQLIVIAFILHPYLVKRLHRH